MKYVAIALVGIWVLTGLSLLADVLGGYSSDVYIDVFAIALVVAQTYLNIEFIKLLGK